MSSTQPSAARRRRWRTALLAVIAVLLCGVLVHHSSFDLPVTQAMNHLHVGPIALLTNTVYRLLEPPGAILLTVITAAVIGWRRRSLRALLVFGATVAITWLPIVAVKMIFFRPRPDTSVLAHPFSPLQIDGSFPSGHTAFITAYAVTLVLTLSGVAAQRARVIGTLLVLLVVFTVLVNGLHFPTDVLASLVWSSALAPAVATLMSASRADSHDLARSR